MKGEDKIIEMLAEYIRRFDIRHEEFKACQKRMEVMTKKISEGRKVFQQNQIEIKGTSKDMKEKHGDMKSMQEEIRQSNIRQEALMKKILSISKESW